MKYHYETKYDDDIDWTKEVLSKLCDKFDDEDIIKHYYIGSYRVYYIEFRTSNLDYELKLDDEYMHWVLSEDGKYIGEFYSGLDYDSDEEIYIVDINIKELNDWIIENVEKHEEKLGITNVTNDLIDSVNELDNFDNEDKVKLIKYLMKKLDVSIEDLE